MNVHASPVALTGSDQTLAAQGNGVYAGYTVRETAGSTAVVRIYDALSATGTLLDSISLAANESKNAWYGHGGIRYATGVYVDIVSGAVEGSVRIG